MLVIALQTALILSLYVILRLIYESVMCGIRAYGDVRFGEGYAQGKAERDLAIALTVPLRMGVMSGDITSKIFEKVDITPGCTTEFPLDFLAPGEDKKFVPYVIPKNYAMAAEEMEDRGYSEESRGLFEKGLKEAKDGVFATISQDIIDREFGYEIPFETKWAVLGPVGRYKDWLSVEDIVEYCQHVDRDHRSEYVKETEKEWTAGKEQAWMKKEDIEKAVDMRYMPKNQWEEHYGSAVPTTKMTTRNIPPTSG